MAVDLSQRDEFAEWMAAHVESYGSCPIEAGLVGNLADNECEHGGLPSDKRPSCLCFATPSPKDGRP